jgi:hypothetical protein
MPQFRDEHMQTPGIEETVISPKFQQNVLRIDHLIPVLTKPFQYFRLAVGEFLSHSGMQQCLRDRIEQITSYLKTAGNLCLRAFPISALIRMISSCMPKGFFR